jgi:hypothetical protein
MNTIFKTDAHREEFVRAFKKLTMSGAVDKDRAIERLIQQNPHYFHQPTDGEIVNLSRSELNDEIRERARAGLQSDKLADRIFNNIPPTDQKPS